MRVEGRQNGLEAAAVAEEEEAVVVEEAVLQLPERRSASGPCATRAELAGDDAWRDGHEELVEQAVARRAARPGWDRPRRSAPCPRALRTAPARSTNGPSPARSSGTPSGAGTDALGHDERRAARCEQLLGATDVVGVGHDVELQLPEEWEPGTARRSRCRGPRRTPSACSRSAANTAWSSRLPSPPDTPPTAVPPSADEIMLSRTNARSVGTRLRGARRVRRPPRQACRPGRDRGCASVNPTQPRVTFAGAR